MKPKLLLPEDNLDHMKNAIAKAKEEINADLVVFLDLSIFGYIK
jgi:predicted amidohydrolase